MNSKIHAAPYTNLKYIVSYVELKQINHFMRQIAALLSCFFQLCTFQNIEDLND